MSLTHLVILDAYNCFLSGHMSKDILIRVVWIIKVRILQLRCESK